MSTAFSWPLPLAKWAARIHSRGDVHIWAASLDPGPGILAELQTLLAPDELQRAGRFHFNHHRDRFIAGRGWLRRLLGEYLGSDPAALRFVYGPNGKPALAGNELEFNLSHSEDVGLLAVSSGLRVGVDIEAVRPLSDAGELVARFFSTREGAAYRQVAVDQQPEAFFHLWTRKEALLKATGQGIGELLNQVEVAFLADEPVRFKSLPANVGTHWQLYDLSPVAGYAAALATAVPASTMECWRWEWHGI